VHDEANHVRRGRIEPLHVVDRPNDGRLGRGGAKDRECAACDGDSIRRSLSSRAQQRQVERLALRLGKGVEHRVGHAVEEVAEPEKREGPLGFRRPTDEHAVRALTRRVDRGAPDGGLADPGLALEQAQQAPPRWRLGTAPPPLSPTAVRPAPSLTCLVG
jgi:hypothetical protein